MGCSSLLLWSAVLLLLLPSLRLRPRPRLILLFSMEPMPDTHMLPDMPDTAMDTHMPMAFMERDLLMLSQRLMPTTMDMLLLMLMVLTHIPMVPMEESGDKLNATQLKEAQKQTTNINDTQFPKNKLNYCWCRNLS